MLPTSRNLKEKTRDNNGLSAENVMHSDRRITIMASTFYNNIIPCELQPDDFNNNNNNN